MSECFWDAFSRSLIIQGMIALVLLCVISYLYVTVQPVPQELISLFSLILGYYFGTKSSAEAQRTLRAAHLEEKTNV